MSNVMKIAVAVGLVLSASISQADFLDNFDSYSVGSANGQGGWKGWDNNSAAAGEISADFSSSSPNSLKIFGAADAVHEFSGSTSGIWEFTMKQYVPSTNVNSTYVILMNNYSDGGPYSWSVQLNCDMSQGLVISDNGGGVSLPMVKNQWVPIKFIIDLDSNVVSEYYNNQPLSTHAWSGDALRALKAVDFYANSTESVYYDDLQLLAIPEPMTGTLLGVVAVAMLLRRRRVRG